MNETQHQTALFVHSFSVQLLEEGNMRPTREMNSLVRHSWLPYKFSVTWCFQDPQIAISTSALQTEKPECTVKLKGIAQPTFQGLSVVSCLWEFPPHLLGCQAAHVLGVACVLMLFSDVSHSRYFSALSRGDPLPVKDRIEMPVATQKTDTGLTQGLLKVLHKQVGELLNCPSFCSHTVTL